MTATIVVGLQFGDEGKGKVTDTLMATHDVCVRYSGGPNTGASVWVNNELFKFHHIPVGLIRNKLCYLGSQVYIDPIRLFEEIEYFKLKGFEVTPNNLRISADANIITAEHKSEDEKIESSGCGVGSTKRGMSPAATAKYSRRAIKAVELPELQPYICDISKELNYHLSQGKSILFEGSQGALLDIDHGFYPYISTSNNVAAAACVSCGVGMQHITSVVGIAKPYMTKVGDGPFPTELLGDEKETAERIVERGGEYGTTTGRPRRVGWLDLPLLEHAVRVNGCSDIFLTKCDILIPETIKVCITYEKDESGYFMNKSNLSKMKPVYKEMNFEELQARITVITGVPILGTGWGKNRVEL